MILLAYTLGLISIATGFTYHHFPTDLCTGSLVEGLTTATHEECFNPYRPSPSNHIYHQPEVTSPAKLNDVKVTCFLDKNRNPALNISMRATSPDSPQEYELTVLVPEVHFTSVYCGKLLTRRPSRTPSKQNIGLEMRCEGNILKASSGVSISVLVKGENRPQTFEYKIPDCKHAVMYNSKECEKARKDRITFRLRQKNNSTVVILDKKSAYRTAGSKLYATIKQRKDGYLDGWKSIREEPKVLYWPERVTIFDDLTPGEFYQVTVWRPDEIVRYKKNITIERRLSTKKTNKKYMKNKKQARLEKERVTVKY